MKKFSLIVALLAVFGTTAMAADAQRNVGAGFGSYILEDNDGLAAQVVAAILNGCFCNQCFAITSGTLNAEKPDKFVQNENLHNFVAENMDNLARDIANGDGEALDTVIELMDVNANQRATAKATLKANFAKIYGSDEVTERDVISTISSLIKA